MSLLFFILIANKNVKILVVECSRNTSPQSSVSSQQFLFSDKYGIFHLPTAYCQLIYLDKKVCKITKFFRKPDFVWYN